MTRTECQPRESGMLNTQDQIDVQKLFDSAKSNGGIKIYNRSEEGSFFVVAHGSGKKNSEMILETDTHGDGKLLLKYRRGRRFWHDNGATRLAEYRWPYNTKPENSHPTTEMRDRILKQTCEIFVGVKKQP